jgi:hypothetical protein
MYPSNAKQRAEHIKFWRASARSSLRDPLDSARLLHKYARRGDSVMRRRTVEGKRARRLRSFLSGRHMAS